MEHPFRIVLLAPPIQQPENSNELRGLKQIVRTLPVDLARHLYFPPVSTAKNYLKIKFCVKQSKAIIYLFQNFFVLVDQAFNFFFLLKGKSYENICIHSLNSSEQVR